MYEVKQGSKPVKEISIAQKPIQTKKAIDDDFSY